MDIIEAEDLYDFITRACETPARLRRLGNGEPVIIVGPDYFIWNSFDWLNWQQRQEEKGHAGQRLTPMR